MHTQATTHIVVAVVALLAPALAERVVEPRADPVSSRLGRVSA